MRQTSAYEHIRASEHMEKESQQQQVQSQQDELDNKQKLVEIDRILADTKQKLDAIKVQPVVVKITAHPTSLNQMPWPSPLLPSCRFSVLAAHGR